MVEAGTGVGKSWAYLLPAILSGSRTVISTAKKSLQSQLIKKDLPYLQSKLGIPFTFAPAYGKSNYACMKEVRAHTKPAEYKRTWEWFFEYAPTARWAEIQEAQARYRAKEVTKRKIQLPVAKTRLSAEKCESRNCKYTADCKYLAARQKVHEAHIVVANHWLVGFHLRLRREISEYGLLGEMPYLIVDEAHKFEDGVRAAFTHEIHEAALPQLIRDFENLGEYSARDHSEEFPQKAELLDAWTKMFRRVKPRKNETLTVAAFGEEGSSLLSRLRAVSVLLDSQSVIRNILECGPSQARAIRSTLTPLGGRAISPAPETSTESRNYRATGLTESQLGLWFSLQTIKRRLLKIGEALDSIYTEDENRVSYLENVGRYCAIRIAPIDIAPFMKTAYEDITSTIYVSATLAVNNKMDIFSRRTGVVSVDTSKTVAARFGSAFDLDKQALLYISKNVPMATRVEGKVDTYRQALADEIYDLTHAVQGNSLVLFTARDEMRAVRDMLETRSQYPLLVQDKTSAAELLDQYRRTDNAILLGLKSFWEGIDIPGTKLSLVVITKLPFPGRQDPVVTARRARAGDAWFPRVDLPDMILDLRQGIGRLIRTKQDRGVIAILDQRLLTKRYKSQVINSLGITKVTTSSVRTLRALRQLAQRPHSQCVSALK